MDSHDPQPSHPHPHQLQMEKVVSVAPNPLKENVPAIMMEPTTTQFTMLNIDSNPSPHSEPFNNDNDPSTLKPCVGASSGSGSIKRKRGRPRKYFLDGNIALSSGSGPIQDATITSPSSSIAKNCRRGRGRPCGSFKKKQQVEVLGVTDTSFSPYLISVNHGEDIVSKLMTFCQGGPNTEMSIISAHGLVGTVALHHNGSIVTYEDKFELVSLSGTMESFDNSGGYKIMSNFKVSLLTPESHLLVGVIADKLIAASRVKIIVSSFTWDGKKASSNNFKVGPSSTPSSQIAASTGVISQGPSFGSSDDNENSHFSQGHGIYNNASYLIPTMSTYKEKLARQTQK